MGRIFDRRKLCIPYALFLILFVAAPVIVIMYYAFTNGEGRISFDTFLGFFTSGNTIGTLVYSIAVATVVTVICLLIAYPVAYILAGMKRGRQGLLIIFLIPMWINFTLRITALKEVLSYIEGNLAYYPFLNTVIGQTYDFLPFMILPLYTTIIRLDRNLVEAAGDLGADKKRTFLKVILPLTMPGIISGVTMVFLPAMTNYVILDMLYNSTYIMGSLIGSYFSAYNWHKGSMISIVLLALVLIATFYTDRFSDRDSAGGRMVTY